MWVKKIHISVAPVDILASWDGEIPHQGIISRDHTAVSQLEPTEWRILNHNSAWPQRQSFSAIT